MGNRMVRVATLNVWGIRGDWPARRAVLADGFARLRPDLVALQESVVTEEYDQVADVLGDEYHVAHSGSREADGQGISIASRWEPNEVCELDLAAVSARTGDFACTTLIAAVPTPVGSLLLVNHFPDYQLDHERERELQAVVAARFLCGRDEDHVLVVGDQDADPDAASIRFWCGRQSLEGVSVCFRDAWVAAAPAGADRATYTPDNPIMTAAGWPFRRIDHLFVGCGPDGPTLAVSGCRRLFDAPVDGVWASDHFGLVADLESA